MGTVTTLPRGRSLTRRDLDSMPEDGHRYELIDGCLVVTPAPTPRHQIVVVGLWEVLKAACPAHLRVLVAPLDVVLSDDTVVQPDALVARPGRLLRTRPAGRSTARRRGALDEHPPHRRRPQAAPLRGRRSPVVLGRRSRPPEPDRLGPPGGADLEGAHVEGDGEYAAEPPFPVTIRPRRLLD